MVNITEKIKEYEISLLSLQMVCEINLLSKQGSRMKCEGLKVQSVSLDVEM